jgi:cell wall-associated NlpC family hydrolase
MKASDHKYIGLPWKDGGRTRAGVDCVGLAVLWLAEHYNFKAPVPDSQQHGRATQLVKDRAFDPIGLERGDVVFLANKTGQVRHVAIWLGGGKVLHVIKGYDSRVDNGFTLLRRIGLHPVAAVKPAEAEVLSEALADAAVGEAATWIMIAVSIVLSVVSALLAPKLARFGNKYGRYGFDALVTQTSTEVPLPDLLGAVVVAGNSPYTQLSDKNLTSSAADQRANKVIIFASGPVEGLDGADVSFTINGLTYSDKYFKNGTFVQGFYLDPEQTKAEAHTGTILTDTMVPSVSFYTGLPSITVPVDVRADYDRTFPVYGFAGCCYAVFRLIDSSKFPQFNVTLRIKGRLVQLFDADGFITGGSTEPAIAVGDGVTRRFALGDPGWRITKINALTVDGVTWTELSATNQTGDVYYVNYAKGYVEFPDNIPGVGEDIGVNQVGFRPEWTANPASHILYLLTEEGRGKGYDASKINFPSFEAAKVYYNEVVAWQNANGVTSGPRYTTNYAVDFRKPIQEHLRALLDACRSVLFISDGKFVLKPIKAAASVFSFDSSNILKESFGSELVDRAERPNRVKAFYHSSDTYQAETEAVREDVIDQAAREVRAGNGGVVEENLKFPAVDNQSQAERLAEIFLRNEINSVWRCSFKTTVLGLAIEVGDIVDVTHPSQPTWTAKLFRVEDYKLDEDGRIEFQLSEYFSGAEI